MRIHVVSPVVGEDIGHSLDYFSRVASPGTEVTIVGLEEGPSAIESDYDISLAAPGIVRRAKEAETSGADAVIINCMADPALYASREAVRIPVVAPAQTAFALAASLTDRFSVLGTTSRDVPFTRDLWRRYGHVERGASVRVLGLTVWWRHRWLRSKRMASVRSSLAAPLWPSTAGNWPTHWSHEGTMAW